MKLKRQIGKIISNGIVETMKEKVKFDEDFSKTSNRIAEMKAEMQAKKKDRQLIRNR
ncbi:hypothetical protein [Paenibacillus sp. 32O-W]|uniref:hypothetical protein n=1 Tax=Paenibacillus sp. 32O-W TaxID=1695218 RepID=UPI0016431531|nr:hypothetical protein [Paenibacillus sp. 32O-W]